MASMTVNDFILTMGIALLVAGLVFLGIGAFVLVKNYWGRTCKILQIRPPNWHKKASRMISPGWWEMRALSSMP